MKATEFAASVSVEGDVAVLDSAARSPSAAEQGLLAAYDEVKDAGVVIC